MPKQTTISDTLDRNNGCLELAPTFVQRFYPDFNRLNQKRLKKTATQFIPERWIGSSVEAINPPPIPSGGLSMLAGVRPAVSLRDAIAANPELIGEAVLRAHGA